MGDLSPTGATRCTANRKSGVRCSANAIRGSKPPRCPAHVGKTLARAKAEGQIRVDLETWGVDETIVDPADQLLRLISQSARRAAHYADLLESEYMEKKTAALIGVHYVTTSGDAEGTTKAVASGEYIRGLAQLEMNERQFCAKLCTQAVTAGIEERRVRLAERQVDQLDVVLRAVILGLGHDPDAPDVRRLVSSQITTLVQ